MMAKVMEWCGSAELPSLLQRRPDSQRQFVLYDEF